MTHHAFAAALAVMAGLGWIALRAGLRVLWRWRNRDARSSWRGVL